ncbi:hypothetical protein [Methanobrevibacter sp.]|uniref:hypothetical protein n=1 Tax=Methanobrevibacter sp. TaxID=66852 RepID=UPI003866A647
MDTKKILLISLIVVAILTSVAIVSAKDIKDIGFNVSSELKLTEVMVYNLKIVEVITLEFLKML